VSEETGQELTAEEKLSLFIDGIQAYNEGGPDALLERLPDDVVVATAQEWPDGGEFEGHEEIRRFLARFGEAWERIIFQYDDPEVIGDRILCASRWVALGKTSAIETTIDFFTVGTVRGEELARLDFFFKQREATEFAHGRRKA
jgi:hypothetical protein